jgi:hypothetical protein
MELVEEEGKEEGEEEEGSKGGVGREREGETRTQALHKRLSAIDSHQLSTQKGRATDTATGGQKHANERHNRRTADVCLCAGDTQQKTGNETKTKRDREEHTEKQTNDQRGRERWRQQRSPKSGSEEREREVEADLFGHPGGGPAERNSQTHARTPSHAHTPQQN